mmetsp:Transcript_4255/g.11549  ORF Transcript_4255/g.11549 Transcript_4255/m.11549 type:complete len:426 (+) Transcript_4255:94-1371(+)
MPDFSATPSKDGYSAMPSRSETGSRTPSREPGGRSTGIRTPRIPEPDARSESRSPMQEDRVPGVPGLPQTITGQVMMPIRGKETCGTEFDIPEDAYGATMVAIVRDLTAAGLASQTAAMRQVSLLRLITAVGTMMLNLVLQLGILFYIHTYIVQTSLRAVQLDYERFATEAFTSTGKLKEDVWKTYDGKADLCGIAIMNKPFFMIVLSLWTLTMMGEYRSSSRLARNLSIIPEVSTREEQLDFGSDGIAGEGECLIIGLTKNTRYAVNMFVLIPKYFILFILLIEGSRWLATAVSFGDIILNSVALGFVIGIDEVLYHTLLPIRQQEQVASTNFFVIQKPFDIASVVSDQRGQFRRSALYGAAVAGWVVLFIFFLQDVLPYDLTVLEGICQDYLIESSTPVCTKLSLWRWNEECYRKGDASTITG